MRTRRRAFGETTRSRREGAKRAKNTNLTIAATQRRISEGGSALWSVVGSRGELISVNPSRKPLRSSTPEIPLA